MNKDELKYINENYYKNNIGLNFLVDLVNEVLETENKKPASSMIIEADESSVHLQSSG